MTAKEFLNAVCGGNDYYSVCQDFNNGDIYIIDPVQAKVLAWICGHETDHFISYEGLSRKKQYNALNDFAETPPKERGLPYASD